MKLVPSVFISLAVIFLFFELPKIQAQLSAAQIKAQITEENSWQFIGIGGRYGYMKDIVSKNRIIESDHFPPKSVYQNASSLTIKGLSENNMAAVSLRYDHHRSLITTNNPRVGTAQARLITGLRTLFRAGNYYEAINQNIEWYRTNPDQNGNARDRFDNYIKEGVKNALDIHIKNGLITAAQKLQLIQAHGLNVINPVMTNILNLPLRDKAKFLVAQDVARYVSATG